MPISYGLHVLPTFREKFSTSLFSVIRSAEFPVRNQERCIITIIYIDRIPILFLTVYRKLSETKHRRKTNHLKVRLVCAEACGSSYLPTSWCDVNIHLIYLCYPLKPITSNTFSNSWFRITTSDCLFSRPSFLLILCCYLFYSYLPSDPSPTKCHGR